MANKTPTTIESLTLEQHIGFLVALDDRMIKCKMRMEKPECDKGFWQAEYDIAKSLYDLIKSCDYVEVEEN